jgi:hypothetical protein
MIARALPVTSTTAVRTINTGVFIATSLLRGPRASQSDYRGSNEPTVNAARAAMTSSAHQRFNLAGGLRCELAAVGYREISLDAPGLCRPTLPRSLFRRRSRNVQQPFRRRINTCLCSSLNWGDCRRGRSISRGGFVMTGGLKDVRLMLSTAAEAGTKLTFGEIAERNLSNAVDTGMGQKAGGDLPRGRAGGPAQIRPE